MATTKTTKAAEKTASKRSPRRKTRVEVYDATEQPTPEVAPAIAPDLVAAASEFIAENEKLRRFLRSKRRGRKTATSKAEGRQRNQYDLAPGTTLTRTFKGKEIVVKVIDGGFEFEGVTYKSISALARHIVGYQISGPVFFGLTEASEEVQ